MNTPVNFEIAKLLKEKGFEEPCTVIVTKGNKYHLVSGTEHTLINGMVFTTTKNKGLPEHIYSAPTIAEVIMWLYEKRRIWIRVTPIPYSNNLTHWRWEHMPVKYAERNMGWKKQQDYLSPTEAYESAIEYALNKLIEIVKDGNKM